MPEPWWKTAVAYQIYPSSFADADGDGVGDLRGITARLDHLARLGVDVVWLSPVYRSPMDDAGYDISDYTDVDPLFGTLADLDELLAGVLRQDPRGVLVISRGDEPRWQEQLQGRFARVMPDVVDRIRFLPRLEHADYLNLNAVSSVATRSSIPWL